MLELAELDPQGAGATTSDQPKAAPRVATPPPDGHLPLSPASSAVPPTARKVHVDRRALWTLAAQHASSSWGARAFEFGSFLFLIDIFPNTLLPASIFGFVTTGAAILGSGFVGGWVDRCVELNPPLESDKLTLYVERPGCASCESALSSRKQ